MLLLNSKTGRAVGMGSRGAALRLSNLSADLLAEIISLSRPKEELGMYGEWAYADKWRAYSHFHQLRLVCKRFKSTFEDHPELSPFLWLRNPLPWRPHTQPLTNLIHWLDHHKSFLQCMRATNHEKGFLNVVLTTLRSSHTQLQKMQLMGIEQSVFSRLAPFTSLTHCDLKVTKGSSIQLEAMPHLTELILRSGSFRNLHVISCLAKLVLRDAKVASAGPCHFMSGLEELHLDHSTCQVYHPQGLSVFCQLRVFKSSNSSGLTADLPDDVIEAQGEGDVDS